MGDNEQSIWAIMNPPPVPELPEEDNTFIDNLPKVVLHVYIEGTLTPTLRWKLSKKNNLPLPYPDWETFLKSYNITWNHRKELHGDNGMPTFFEAYYGGMSVLKDESDFYELGMGYFEVAHRMNVRYCEPFFDIQAHTRRGVTIEDVMNGLQRAKEEAEKKWNVKSNWILCFLRDMSPEDATEAYEACRPWQHKMFIAIGLDSNEYDRPPTLFDHIFKKAKEDGLRVTAHCDVGQKDTHEHIEQCLTVLCDGKGVERLDHALNAAERPELVKLIQEKGVGMTLCPHGYHRRLPTEFIFPKFRLLFEAGIPITINSDDPTYFHHMYVQEAVKVVRKYCNFTYEELVQLQVNAVKISWAEEKVKESLMAELTSYLQAHGGSKA